MYTITFEKNFRDRAIDIHRGATLCVKDVKIEGGFIKLPLSKFGNVSVPASHVSIEENKGRIK